LSEEFPLGAVEARSCPFNRFGGDRIHAARTVADRGIMVAKQRHGASLDLAHHGVDDVSRIGAVSDVIAEKDEAADSRTPRMVEGRLERFPVRMDVAE
jgi:hypothetical protein